MTEVATISATDETKELLELLEKLREDSGITKSDLASKLGIGLESLRATLNNRGGEPSLARLRSIADAMGFRMEITIEKK